MVQEREALARLLSAFARGEKRFTFPSLSKLSEKSLFEREGPCRGLLSPLFFPPPLPLPSNHNSLFSSLLLLLPTSFQKPSNNGRRPRYPRRRAPHRGEFHSLVGWRDGKRARAHGRGVGWGWGADVIFRKKIDWEMGLVSSKSRARAAARSRSLSSSSYPISRRVSVYKEILVERGGGFGKGARGRQRALEWQRNLAPGVRRANAMVSGRAHGLTPSHGAATRPVHRP